jgi:hypothetical protein
MPALPRALRGSSIRYQRLALARERDLGCSGIFCRPRSSLLGRRDCRGAVLKRCAMYTRQEGRAAAKPGLAQAEELGFAFWW